MNTLVHAGLAVGGTHSRSRVASQRLLLVRILSKSCSPTDGACFSKDEFKEQATFYGTASCPHRAFQEMGLSQQFHPCMFTGVRKKLSAANRPLPTKALLRASCHRQLSGELASKTEPSGSPIQSPGRNRPRRPRWGGRNLIDAAQWQVLELFVLLLLSIIVGHHCLHPGQLHRTDSACESRGKASCCTL